MKTLVVLPGWGGTKKTWQAFVDFANEKNEIKVIVLNLPCFGEEPCPSEVWGLSEYAQFVKKKIEDSEILSQELTVLGHSFGGAVAVELFRQYPSVAGKLVLIGAAIIRPKLTIKRKVFGTFARVGKWVFDIPFLRSHQQAARKILYKAADSPDYAETAGIQKEIYKKIIREDRFEVLPQIVVPSLVLWGAKDSYVPLSYGKRIAVALPEGTLTVYQNGKHGLHHPPTMETCYRDIKQFVCSTH